MNVSPVDTVADRFGLSFACDGGGYVPESRSLDLLVLKGRLMIILFPYSMPGSDPASL